MPKTLTKEAAISAGEGWLRQNAYDYDHKRRVLVSTPVDSYGSPNYRHELRVLEGSPAKGFLVVLNESEHHGEVIASAAVNGRMRRWEWHGHRALD